MKSGISRSESAAFIRAFIYGYVYTGGTFSGFLNFDLGFVFFFF